MCALTLTCPQLSEPVTLPLQPTTNNVFVLKLEIDYCSDIYRCGGYLSQREIDSSADNLCH